MSVGLRVDSIVDLLGAGSFVGCFFDTIAGNLEPGGRGTRFPVTGGPFFSGHVPHSMVDELRRELADIHAELSDLAPSAVIWSEDDPTLDPPWGSEISTDITSLGNYFVTMNGHDMFDVLEEALAYASSAGFDAVLESTGVTIGDPD